MAFQHGLRCRFGLVVLKKKNRASHLVRKAFKYWKKNDVHAQVLVRTTGSGQGPFWGPFLFGKIFTHLQGGHLPVFWVGAHNSTYEAYNSSWPGKFVAIYIMAGQPTPP